MRIQITEQQLRTVTRLLKESAKLSCEKFNYATLDRMLGGTNYLPIGHNTAIKRVDDGIAVRLHDTHVAEFDDLDLVKVFMGGFRTKTTQSRINKILGCRGAGVYKKNGKWFISGANGSFPFRDGIEITPEGEIVDFDQ